MMSTRVLLWMMMGVLVLWWGRGGVPLVVAEQHSPKPYDAHGKRDPFVPLVRDGRLVSSAGSPSSVATSSELLLSGILWDPTGRSLALINDTEAKVGDTIGGYRVTEIRPDAVVLVRDGKPLVLQISFEERTKPGE